MYLGEQLPLRRGSPGGRPACRRLQRGPPPPRPSHAPPPPQMSGSVRLAARLWRVVARVGCASRHDDRPAGRYRLGCDGACGLKTSPPVDRKRSLGGVALARGCERRSVLRSTLRPAEYQLGGGVFSPWVENVPRRRPRISSRPPGRRRRVLSTPSGICLVKQYWPARVGTRRAAAARLDLSTCGGAKEGVWLRVAGSARVRRLATRPVICRPPAFGAVGFLRGPTRAARRRGRCRCGACTRRRVSGVRRVASADSPAPCSRPRAHRASRSSPATRRLGGLPRCGLCFVAGMRQPRDPTTGRRLSPPSGAAASRPAAAPRASPCAALGAPGGPRGDRVLCGCGGNG